MTGALARLSRARGPWASRLGFAGLAVSITALLSCSSGGGGGGPIDPGGSSEISSPVVAGFTTTSASATEGDGTKSVDVRLTVSVPPLSEAVSLQVIDAGTGTATSGSDYTFVTTDIDFAAGAASGSIETAVIQIHDDGAGEADETVILNLSIVAGSVSLNISTIVVTIADDDLAGTSGLRVSADASVIADGATVDLGSQTVGSGPNAGVTIRIENIGTNLLNFSAPTLTSGDTGEFVIETQTQPFLAAPDLAANSQPQVRGFPGETLGDDPDEGVHVALDLDALRDLDGVSKVTLLAFPIPQLSDFDLELERVRAPWAADAVIHVDGQPGAIDLRSFTDEMSFWRGRVVGYPESSVFLSLSERGSRGWVQCAEIPGGAAHLVSGNPVDGVDAPLASRIVLADQLPPIEDAPLCDGVLNAPGATPQLGLTAKELLPQTANLTLSDVRLAIETDYQFYQNFDDTQATSDYVTQLIAAVSELYYRDVQTTLSIAYLGIHTTAADPWSSPEGAGTTAAVLDEFRNAWSSGGWPVSADLAHFISGANLGGGIAYVDVLCSQNFGFGVSALFGDVDWSTFTLQSQGGYWDFKVVAHELGHNFGANHTHDYCPPLDRCQSSCSGGAVCSEGTIMSYCQFCPGGLSNIQIEFHPTVANIMRDTVNTSCIAQSVLAPGDYLDYQFSFSPNTTTGAKTATVELDHDAPNAPTPFTLTVEGTAQ